MVISDCPQCGFIREGSSWFCRTLLTGGTEKLRHTGFLYLGFNRQAGRRCILTITKERNDSDVQLPRTWLCLSHSRCVQKSCVSVALLNPAARRRPATGWRMCRSTTGHTQTRTRALGLRKAHWVPAPNLISLNQLGWFHESALKSTRQGNMF